MGNQKYGGIEYTQETRDHRREWRGTISQNPALDFLGRNVNPIKDYEFGDPTADNNEIEGLDDAVPI